MQRLTKSLCEIKCNLLSSARRQARAQLGRSMCGRSALLGKTDEIFLGMRPHLLGRARADMG